ncbi:MAG: iron ABC transporter permease [Anaerolineaceae bacterium]
MTKHTARPYLVACMVLIVAILLSIAVGSVSIPFRDLLQILLGKAQQVAETETFKTILYDLRLPRTALLALVGAALAGSGSAYQGIFRNPLADPYLIGVASGAGLGAVLAMSVQWPYTTTGLMAVPVAAFLGAMLTVLVVYELARVGKTLPTTNLILAGVAISSFANALTSFLMLRSTGELRRALVWLMGGAVQTGWESVLAILPYVVIGLGILLINSHALNVMQFGDEQAQQLGIPVQRVRRTVLVAASLTTAAAVSYAGVIGFVGLIVPHMVRLVWGGDYRRVMPLSILGGASFLLIADVMARVVMAPQEIPVGIITALVGAPFFLWILRRARQKYEW